MTSPPRRSTRTRRVNTRYNNGAWDKETLRLLRESSESSNPTSVDSNEKADAEELHSDVEFNEAQSVRSPHEDELSVVSDSSKSGPIGTQDRGEEDAADQAVSEDELSSAPRKIKWRRPAEVHSRGLVVPERSKSARGRVWQSLFGPEYDDLKNVLFAKDRWLLKARDVTLPSRATINEARQRDWPQGDFDDETNSEACRVFQQLESCQKLVSISLEDSRRRLFVTDGVQQKVILGPWSQQQAYDLPHLGEVNIDHAWKRDEQTLNLSPCHSGLIINVGEKPQCVAWAPNQHSSQYLAIACRSTPSQRGEVPQKDPDISPAFAVSAKYPSGIQIWCFDNANSGASDSSAYPKTAPTFTQFLACSFGDVKQMSWVSASLPDGCDTYLGALTLLTTDGCIRLIYVPKPSSNADQVSCIEVVKPAILIEPPVGTIFTCFTSASASDLILGTSSGHIHLYNILQKPSVDNKQEPYFSSQLHHTYVLAVATLGDPATSHLLASTSAAGSLKLTDLRSPTQDTVANQRTQIPTRNLIGSSHTNSFVTTVDSSGNTEPRGNAQTTLISHSLRHFYTGLALSRFPEASGAATALAGSPLHPFILMGNSSGTVWSQNIVRRILPTGKANSINDAGAWIQKLVEYEWNPSPSSDSTPLAEPPSPEDQRSRNETLYHGLPTRSGISRLTQGFHLQNLDLSNLGNKKRKMTMSDTGDATVAMQTIFEEEQAVSALAWNVNESAAGWCAVGWASGLVMICDLSHDML